LGRRTRTREVRIKPLPSINAPIPNIHSLPTGAPVKASVEGDVVTGAVVAAGVVVAGVVWLGDVVGWVVGVVGVVVGVVTGVVEIAVT
jgi:hypothetical protein